MAPLSPDERTPALDWELAFLHGEAKRQFGDDAGPWVDQVRRVCKEDGPGPKLRVLCEGQKIARTLLLECEWFCEIYWSEVAKKKAALQDAAAFAAARDAAITECASATMDGGAERCTGRFATDPACSEGCRKRVGETIRKALERRRSR